MRERPMRPMAEKKCALEKKGKKRAMPTAQRRVEGESEKAFEQVFLFCDGGERGGQFLVAADNLRRLGWKGAGGGANITTQS